MEAQNGVAPNFIDVYVHGHRGSDPTNRDVLCTEAAKEKMMAYGEEMTQRHGPEFNWQQADIHVEALHASGGGRRHGRYAFGTGVVDYNQSVSQARRLSSSGGRSCSSRTARDTLAEEDARAAREEARQAIQTVECPSNMTSYLASYVQDITARLGPDVNLPPFCPPQMSPQQGGCHHPRVAATSGVDDGTPALPATSGVEDGTPAIPATSGVDDSTPGLPATSGWMAPQGSQPAPGWMAPQGFQPALGWMAPPGSQPPSGWMPATTPNFNPWMQS
ncbi:hypothetical protein U9M48_024990 [Paspalum notatum var. saurae]|uniref:Uncharacterized protein n=1 Tax=Paspalum notatum var. saurae TaxID=547442 RepID=A0AAQ3TPV6_PASNO